MYNIFLIRMSSQKIKDIIQLNVGPDFRLLEAQQIQLLLLKMVVLKKIGGKKNLSPNLKTILDGFVKKRTTTCLRQAVCNKHFNAINLDDLLNEDTGIPISAWNLDTAKYADKLSMSKEKKKVKDLLEKIEDIEKSMNLTKPTQDLADVKATVSGLKSSISKMNKDLIPLKKEINLLQEKKNNYDILYKKYIDNVQYQGTQRLSLEKKKVEHLTVKQYAESKVIDITTLKDDQLKKDILQLKKLNKLKKENDDEYKQLQKDKEKFSSLENKKKEFESKMSVLSTSESKLVTQTTLLESYEVKSKILQAYVKDDKIAATDKTLSLRNIIDYKPPSYPSIDKLWQDLKENKISAKEINDLSNKRQIQKNTLKKIYQQKVPKIKDIESARTVNDHINYLVFLSSASSNKKNNMVNKVKIYDSMDTKTLSMISTKKSHKKFKNLRY